MLFVFVLLILCPAACEAFWQTFIKHQTLKSSYARFASTIENVEYVPKPVVEPLTGVKTKISQFFTIEDLESVQLRHIEVETEEMAVFCKSLIIQGRYVTHYIVTFLP